MKFAKQVGLLYILEYFHADFTEILTLLMIEDPADTAVEKAFPDYVGKNPVGPPKPPLVQISVFEFLAFVEFIPLIWFRIFEPVETFSFPCRILIVFGDIMFHPSEIVVLQSCVDVANTSC